MISILVPVGNRRDDLMLCLESCNAQTYPHETIVSVMGDTQNCAELAESMGAKAFVTGGHVFNKAKALNAAAGIARGERLLLLDADCSFSEPQSLNKIVGRAEEADKGNFGFNLRMYSFGTLGTILVKPGMWSALGGMDETLGDIWAPDDLDLIARHLTTDQSMDMPRRYWYFSKSGTYYWRTDPDPVEGWVTSMQRPKRGATNPVWIVNRGAQRRHRPKAGPFYDRIGGHHGDPGADLLATVRYFQKQRAPRA